MNTHHGFPPIGRHGVIGDQRTGALAAADGTLDWFCVPDFDDQPVFGALLDPVRGGFCRFGPQAASLGRQSYLSGTAVLVTRWEDAAKRVNIELADVMAWPMDERPEELCGQRVVIRRLRVMKDAVALFELCPRRDFAVVQEPARPTKGGAVFAFSDGALGLWSSFAINVEAHSALAVLALRRGDEHWVVLGWNMSPEEWSALQAAKIFTDVENYWRAWTSKLNVKHCGTRGRALRHSALTVQLLRHVQFDSAVAALTTSLPERLGGDRNYDYRYAWVRDASLSLALLARMGKTTEVKGYLDWLCRLRSTTESPLQVCYRIDGNPYLDQEEISGLRGYEDSRPVRRGNRAAKQLQLGSLGFFADCARIYIDHGGEWREQFWQLLKSVADFTCDHWQQKDSGVWELPEEAHYVASRVMCWVVLERAVYIAKRTGRNEEIGHWRETAATIHAEVMDKGWCEEKNAFRQRYGSDALDAAALLIPLMEFLPIDHPRVTGTLDALESELVVGGLIHRFDPAATLGGKQLPIGQFEGAFLPCVFWHAHTLAKVGRCDEAEAILSKCETIAGETGLFAEEVDAKHNTFLGNTPLLFAHVEYVRAVLEVSKARRQ